MPGQCRATVRHLHEVPRMIDLEAQFKRSYLGATIAVARCRFFTLPLPVAVATVIIGSVAWGMFLSALTYGIAAYFTA